MEYSVAVFGRAAEVASILVTMEANPLVESTKLLDSGRFPKLRVVLPGGATRNDTTKAALYVIDDAVDTANASADIIIDVNSETAFRPSPVEPPCAGGLKPQAFRRDMLEAA